MSFDAPQSRNEAILQNILGAENVLAPVQSEIEAILLAILNDTSYSLEGRSRIARLLIAIKNNGTWDELPCISRNEEILYCILNGEAFQGETYSRNEELLKQWSESHATYEKTVSGNPIHVTDAVEESALALSVAFEPTQAGTPFVGDTTNEPYLSKTASTTGNKRYLDKIVGGTVAWNQLVDTDTTSVTVLTGHKYIAKINGTWTSGNGGTVSVTGGTDMLIDLTLMFGRSDIADYIYSLEQAETGAGVQWLKDYGFIDENYRTYNPGELISCRPEGIRYGSTTHAFGSAVELRGLYKLDANNKLYCDGDELMPDGVVTTKFAEINLGDYTYSETVMSNNRKLFSTSYLNFPKTPYFNTNIPTPSICPIGIVTYMRASAWNVGEYVFASNSSIIPESKALGFIVDATKYADATAFKNAVSGIHLVYLTATPTTSASTPYTNPAPISNGDTEAFIDTRSIPLPVGNNSHYAGEYEIEGHESVTVYQAQTQDEPNPTEYEVEFTEQGTVYGGVIDIVTGALSITWGYIASYNGETLTGRWISSLDEYAEGTTPTTGAEVAYELASPITAELTPQQVDMLLGENTVWTDDASDSISLTYIGTNPAVQLLAGLRKNSNNAKMVKLLKGGLKDAEIIRK